MKDLYGSTKQLYIGHHSRPTRRLYAGPLVSLPSYEIIIDWSFTKGSLSSLRKMIVGSLAKDLCRFI